MHPSSPLQCLRNEHASSPLWDCCEHSGSQAAYVRPLEPIVSPEERRLSITQSRDCGRPENVHHRPLVSIWQARHVRSWSTRRSQGHRTRSATPVRQTSATPSPPRSRGLRTISQATLHRPPKTEAEPHQMNALWSLSMHSIAHEDRHIAINVWTGMADKVVLTSVVLPAMFSRLPFH